MKKEEEYPPRIMNITNGDEVKGYWETKKEAEEWINEQDNPSMFMIMKND